MEVKRSRVKTTGKDSAQTIYTRYFDNIHASDAIFKACPLLEGIPAR